jgi:hypothetical protein
MLRNDIQTTNNTAQILFSGQQTLEKGLEKAQQQRN